MRAVQEIDFAAVKLNKYEDRPGTVSSRMENKVPQIEIDRRYNEIERALYAPREA